MDGTFIPLEGNADNIRDLPILTEELQRHSVELMYVTGRDFALVQAAIAEHTLPTPTWMICDVGSSIYRLKDDTCQHVLLTEYQQHLNSRVGSINVNRLAECFDSHRRLVRQEASKQGQFKLSYYTDAAALPSTTVELKVIIREQDLPYELIASVDPFTGDGLIDFLPAGVSKAYALRWWASFTGQKEESIVFAGDSGNDIAALTSGYRSIIVGNASKALIDEVRQTHKSAGWSDRLRIANSPATSGVLEGLREFINS